MVSFSGMASTWSFSSQHSPKTWLSVDANRAATVCFRVLSIWATPLSDSHGVFVYCNATHLGENLDEPSANVVPGRVEYGICMLLENLFAAAVDRKSVV